MRPEHMITAWVLGLLITTGTSDDVTSTFQTLVQDYWTWRQQDAPEFASTYGFKSYNDKVESYSLEILETRKNKVDGFIRRLNQMESTRLSKTDRVSYKVLKDTLQTYLDGYKWRFYGPMNPLNFLEGFWTDPKTYAIFDEFKTKKDLEDFIQRLHGWTDRVQEYETRMLQAIEMNTTNNWVSAGDRLLNQLDGIDVDPVQFVLYEPFNETLENMTIPNQQKNTLRHNAQEAIRKLLDAYKGLKTFMITVYKNETRQAWGVNSFNDGVDYYKACLKWHLSVEITPEEVHEKGFQEVERIYKKMITIMNRLNFHGSISEFFSSLKNDTKFIINDPDATIEKFRDIIFDRIKPKLQKYFQNIPDMPVSIQKMPYDGPGGQYMSGSPDGSRPGKFQANVLRPKDNPTFDMVALALHEADPGHHLQDIYSQASAGLPGFRKVIDYEKYFSIPYHFPFYTSYTEDIFAQASAGLPFFRKVIDNNKYFSAPYFFPFYTAYIEGWALYSESLGEKDELDIYEDDYELMGRYSSEIFRACRLVVDTGLHYYNWTRENAIQYMLNYTSYSRPAISIEIDRYITWPGQACAYKIGELKIRELRNRAESLLGDMFDIKGFHSVILDNGAVPLNVLEELVTEWIQDVIDANAENIFTTVTKDFWKWKQRDNPELSTFAGHYKYNDKLESFNYTVFKDRLDQARMFLGKLDNLDSAKLSTKQKVSYDVLKNMLTTYIEGYAWRNYGNINPFNFIEGFLKDPGSYTFGTPFDTRGDFINFVRRVELFSQQYDEMIELARKAIDLKTTDHHVSVNRISTQMDKVIVDNPVDFVLYKPINKSAAEVFDGDTSYIESRMNTATMQLIDKLKEVKTFITKEYMPNTRQGLGVAHLTNGSEYYKACLKWHTSLDITPEEVHQTGLNEVDRIAKEMKQTRPASTMYSPKNNNWKVCLEPYAYGRNLIAASGQAMVRLNFPSDFTIKEAYAAMANDSQFFITDGEKTLERYRQIIFQRIQPKLQHVMNSPSDGISGEYMSGSEDGILPGIFFANVRRPEDNPTYAMVSLSLHEAIPGHHLAESYGMTSDLPDFRKLYSWRSYSAPFYFPFFNSYVEGWALYSEYLGEEMGVYENDYELMGRYSDEMWRACRLVIDTGIHYFNWTREQSIYYIMNYTAITRQTAEIEIDRYTTWPGQACGYKIGEMKIKQLRKNAENVLGAAFDIRDFHYAILSNGPVPLDVLEDIVNNWITTVTQKPLIPTQQTCKPVIPDRFHTTVHANVNNEPRTVSMKNATKTVPNSKPSAKPPPSNTKPSGSNSSPTLHLQYISIMITFLFGAAYCM